METIKVNGTDREVGDILFPLGSMPSASLNRKAIQEFLPEIYEICGKNELFHEQVASIHEKNGLIVEFIFTKPDASEEEMRETLLPLLAEAATLRSERERARSRSHHPANTTGGDSEAKKEGKSPKLRVVKRPLFKR